MSTLAAAPLYTDDQIALIAIAMFVIGVAGLLVGQILMAILIALTFAAPFLLFAGAIVAGLAVLFFAFKYTSFIWIPVLNVLLWLLEYTIKGLGIIVAVLGVYSLVTWSNGFAPAFHFVMRMV